MARSESDREDLLRDASALTERTEWKITGEAETVVVGFRRTGDFSAYFGSDPVYQFDAEGRLRRAFVGGLLYRSQGSTLAELKKVRSADTTELRRIDLAPLALSQFLSEARHRLEAFYEALDQDRITVIGQIPADAELRPRVCHYLIKLLEGPLRLAAALKR